MSKVTVDGISLNVDEAIFEDWEFLEKISETQKETENPLEQMNALVGAFKMLLGKDYERVKIELRKKHDGALSVDTMSKFFEKLSKSVEALKN